MENTQKEDVVYEEALMKDLKGEFIMPKWLDCTWRRVPCGQGGCPLCGLVERDQKDQLDQVALYINSAMVMVREEMDNRPQMSLSSAYAGERPKLSSFPEGLETVSWCKQVVQIGRLALDYKEAWLFTAAAADLFWYVDVLAVKVARQLVNRWDLEQGDKETLPDHQYTKWVIGQCCAILQSSLEELALLDSMQKAELMLALLQLSKLKEILVAI